MSDFISSHLPKTLRPPTLHNPHDPPELMCPLSQMTNTHGRSDCGMRNDYGITKEKYDEWINRTELYHNLHENRRKQSGGFQEDIGLLQKVCKCTILNLLNISVLGIILIF